MNSRTDGEVSIDLEQNVNDTADNKWRKRLSVFAKIAAILTIYSKLLDNRTIDNYCLRM